MRISALEEYGLRCLLALAQEGQGGQLSISEIADKEGISIPYASKLLSILKKTGLVKAIRGRTGGFSITRIPQEITLLEIITALGGPLIDPKHCTKFSGQLEKCIHTEGCTVHYTLAGLALLMGEFLSKTSLEDIKRGADIKNKIDGKLEKSILNASMKKYIGENQNKSTNREKQNFKI